MKKVSRSLWLLCLSLAACAHPKLQIGHLPSHVDCLAVAPFEVRYDPTAPREMISEFIALDLYRFGAHGVLGPVELTSLFSRARDPLPPAIDPYWARVIGKKLHVDAVLFGSIAQMPVVRGEVSQQLLHYSIDAYLIDVEGGAIQWVYGVKEETEPENYMARLSNHAEEMAQTLLAARGDLDAFGKRGCWKEPAAVAEVKVAKKRKLPPLTASQKALRRRLQSKSGVSLENWIFDGRSARLAKQAVPMLRKLSAVLSRAGKPTQVQIASHVDSTVDHVSDLTLSKQRAAVLKRYLIRLGVPEAKLKAVGYGGSSPIVPNINNKSRQLNRRTEIVPIRVKSKR